ncbi:hypothetical protein OEZ86_008175 [Tetradesmus obliquus]|nr:hypothetical protein OEZ86_008175 [Tetradesmus obliquus]
MAQQLTQDVYLAAPASQYSLSPVEGAGKVVDVLKKSGTLDTLRGKALDAMKHNESLRSQIEQMLQQAELLQPGKTYSKSEAERVVANFYNRNEKQLHLPCW